MGAIFHVVPQQDVRQAVADPRIPTGVLRMCLITNYI